MASCCHICVDPSCNGKHNCNCDTCARKAECHRYAGLKPTFRITTRCTQTCAHCAFECGPKSSDMMSVETARQIGQFCRSNQINRCEVMGGEFFMNPHWEEILHLLGEEMISVRLVSNADWAGDEDLGARVVTFLRNHPQFHVGISRDQWHTNRHVDTACEMLTEAGVRHRIPTADEVEERTIVPVGRSQFDCGNFYGMFATYCSKPDRRYSFLVDENGEVYKCGFGSWPYANIRDYVDGGFSERFKEFGTVFYQNFLSSCKSCRRAEHSAT